MNVELVLNRKSLILSQLSKEINNSTSSISPLQQQSNNNLNKSQTDKFNAFLSLQKLSKFTSFKSLSLKNTDKLNSDGSKRYLYENQEINSNGKYFYTTTRPWCNQINDYCPLVIALMSFIILTSIVLIVYLCVKSSLKCKTLRKFVISFKQKLFGRSSNQLNRQRSTMSAIRPVSNTTTSRTPTRTNTTTAPIDPLYHRLSTTRFTNPINSTTNNSVWFTDISKYSRPPPSYEESQQIQMQNIRGGSLISKQAPFNRIIRTYPRKFSTLNISQSASINNAFSMENLNETSPNTIESTNVNSNNLNTVDSPTRARPLFPSYRCVALTTSPSTQATIQRLSNLSRQLLEENRFCQEILGQDELPTATNTGTIGSNMDEVPPSYESIVVTTNNTINTNSTNNSFRNSNNQNSNQTRSLNENQVSRELFI